MLSAADILRDIEARLLQTGGVPIGPSVADVDQRDETGQLRVTLEYSSGHRLQVDVTVDVSPGYPVWTHYRMHLQDGATQCVFRYDNAPHHPHVLTHPDHKHVGPAETVEAAYLPSIGRLAIEVAQAVAAGRSP